MPLQIILLFLTTLNAFAPSVHGAKCACATGNVYVRNGAGTSHKTLTAIVKGDCATYKGDEVKVGTVTWSHVEYKGHTGYASKAYLNYQDCSGAAHTATHAPTHQGTATHNTGTHQGSKQQLSGCPHIVSRTAWGARPPKNRAAPLPSTPLNVYVHHGASAACKTMVECKAIVRSYQNYHMNTHGWNDLGYTFVIGEDGNVYEGVGWGKIGTHTLNHNADGLGFCVIGNFMHRLPNAKAITALKQLIKCGVNHGKIRTHYKLYGHRDVRQTACPGQKFYDLIKEWPHFFKHHN